MENKIDLIKEAVTKFIIYESIILSPTFGGVNNFVYYIEDNLNKKYVVRIYNNGNDTNRVHFEHLILI